MAGVARVAVFLDLASLEMMTSHHGGRVAYGPLLERLVGDRRLVRAAAYGARDDDHPESAQRLDELATQGFKVIAKPMRRRADGVRRANVNVNIAVDALELAPHIDVLSLLTTDEDLGILVEAVQRRGVRVEVITIREFAPAALVEVADAAIEFASVIEFAPSQQQRSRSLPKERGNARPRLEPPPPRRRQRRRSPSRPDPEAEKTVQTAVAARDASDVKPKAEEPKPPAAAEPPPAAKPPSAAEPPPRPSPEPAAEAPPPPAVKVLPQEKLSGRIVRRSSDEA
jgi:uncharacterized LabA/DUF88 family protein